MTHSSQCNRALLSLLSLLIFFALLAPSFASAQTQYVQPSSEIPVRRGLGTKYKIIAIVKDGTALEVLDEKESWSRVKLKNGKEGWMPKRFLGSTPPLDKQLAKITEEKTLLGEQVEALQIKLEEVTEIQQKTAQELASCIAERNDINRQYKTLQRDTIDVVQTKEDLAAARSAIEQLKQENSSVKIDNSVLRKNETIKWFLSGGGVILLGWLLGRFSRSPKKRKSSLLS